MADSFAVRSYLSLSAEFSLKLKKVVVLLLSFMPRMENYDFTSFGRFTIKKAVPSMLRHEFTIEVCLGEYFLTFVFSAIL